MNKDILYIIGGSGFVGKNMVRCLHEKYAISVFDKYRNILHRFRMCNVTKLN